DLDELALTRDDALGGRHLGADDVRVVADDRHPGGELAVLVVDDEDPDDERDQHQRDHRDQVAQLAADGGLAHGTLPSAGPPAALSCGGAAWSHGASGWWSGGDFGAAGRVPSGGAIALP